MPPRIPDLRNAIGNFLNQLFHRLLPLRGGQLRAHRGKLEGAVGAQVFGAFQLLTDTLFDHGGTMLVGGGHDNQGFTLSGIAQGRQDRVLVPEDARLQDLQAMLADVLPVAGKRGSWYKRPTIRALASGLMPQPLSVTETWTKSGSFSVRRAFTMTDPRRGELDGIVDEIT